MVDASKEILAGQRLLAQMKYKEAMSKFNRAIKIDPNNPEAYFGKAEAATCIPKISEEEVIEAYKKAIDLNAKNPLYYQRLGAFYLDIGRFKDAEKCYRKAVEIDSEGAGYYLSELAFEYYQSAIRRLDEDAKNEELDKIIKNSILYFLQAIDVDPEHAKRLLSE